MVYGMVIAINMRIPFLPLLPLPLLLGAVVIMLKTRYNIQSAIKNIYSNRGYEMTEDNKEMTEDNKGIVHIIIALIVVSIIILSILLDLNSEDCFDVVMTITSIVLIIFAFIVMPKMKEFLLNSGRKILDFTTALDLLSTFAIIIVGLFISRETYGSYNEIKPTFWWWVLGGAIYFVTTIMKNYLLYILVDIRDNLKKIADSKEQKSIDENKE